MFSCCAYIFGAGIFLLNKKFDEEDASANDEDGEERASLTASRFGALDVDIAAHGGVASF